MPSDPAATAPASRHRTCRTTSARVPGTSTPAPSVIPTSLRPRRALSACAGALALAALPKCPLCLLAWAGVAGSAGFASAYGAWLLPATAVSLAVTVGALALAGAGGGPLLLAAAGAAGVLGGKFRLDDPALRYAGVAALLAATAWGVLRRKPAPARACTTRCAAAAPPSARSTTA